LKEKQINGTLEKYEYIDLKREKGTQQWRKLYTKK
jgi:hypothetical protein